MDTSKPHNHVLQIAALTLTKISDGLANAKLVMPWLLGALGAPVILIGFLVPIREALSLLPQLLVAQRIAKLPRRKWAWIVAGVIQGSALIGIALVALTMRGPIAGILILIALAIYSLARSVCSVAVKEVLGKTVTKGRRGRISGTSSALAGVVVSAFGAYLAYFGDLTDHRELAIAVGVAALLWLIAAGVYSRISESKSERVKPAQQSPWRQLTLLQSDSVFRRFLVVRALLVSTALITPFVVLLASSRDQDSLIGLGLLVIASGLAGALSSAIWGRWSDRSSRSVLMVAGCIASTSGLLISLTEWLAPHLGSCRWWYAIGIFTLAVAHAGVRVGRSTYIVDLASEKMRGAYVAVGNTVIGGVLVIGAAFGAFAEVVGIPIVVATLALLALFAAGLARKLPEVE